ncbi:peptidoglycan DD-metalloendopeptidase family protein [Roseibacterium beibuensis]|uniref:M23 family metallopeptidase n=1 Tax=[Roseibacterium] beibuensis TaxID=1193142 RepID=A0ABP9LA70_9RHOB|nr:peptidoglycan DD-metalloendopeptidase family protein [Roseibacterium beibuensis]MCS6624073.1 peptidoglycan DD-metalloendopeptidase family protein [Roseibacterium beibuensis]
MPRLTPILALGLSVPLLAGCVGAVSELDFDFRGGPISSGVGSETAPRPEPDANGLITYESYQMVVARRGDTVADVATRVGLSPEELARFNGRNATDTLRADEVLAMPRRVTPGAGAGTDIAALARGAIDEAEARGPSASGPALQPGQEPVQHRVGRGETAYSIARLYGVSVRSLAEWNGLGPDLAVREGQYLIIPIVIEQAAAETEAQRPGASIAPPPPSAANPLPDAIEAAPLPPATGGGPAAPAPAPQPDTNARFVRPVDGSVLRDFSAGTDGIDYAAPAGTAVRAAANGTVAAITQDTDQIPILVIRHEDGLLTVYANIQNIRVSRGDSVSRGQSVAEVGAGDPSFLHFEVRRGFESVDPAQFLP